MPFGQAALRPFEIVQLIARSLAFGAANHIEDAWQSYEEHATCNLPKWQWSGVFGLLAMHERSQDHNGDIMRSLAHVHWSTDSAITKMLVEHGLERVFPDLSLGRIKFKIASLGRYHLTGNEPDRATEAFWRTAVYREIRDRWIRTYLNNMRRHDRINEFQDIAQAVDLGFLTKARRGDLLKFDPARHQTAEAWYSTVIHNLVRNAMWPLFMRLRKSMPSLVEDRAVTTRVPSEIVAAQELINALLAKFGREQVEIIALHAVDGEPFAAIGTRFKISEDAARMRFNRAILRARNYLEQLDQ